MSVRQRSQMLRPEKRFLNERSILLAARRAPCQTGVSSPYIRERICENSSCHFSWRCDVAAVTVVIVGSRVMVTSSFS